MATLFLPLQVAVATGVILTVLLYVYRSAEQVRIERVVPLEGGGFAEAEAPEEVPSGEILILQPIGSLFFAGVAEFDEKLPAVGDGHESVVIIRLRDRDEVGSTFIRLLRRYARSLHEQDNLLMLEGLNERVLEQLRNTDVLDLIGADNVFMAEPQFGVAASEAFAAAERWIAQA